jgi:hypothetical protein
MAAPPHLRLLFAGDAMLGHIVKDYIRCLSVCCCASVGAREH